MPAVVDEGAHNVEGVKRVSPENFNFFHEKVTFWCISYAVKIKFNFITALCTLV